VAKQEQAMYAIAARDNEDSQAILRLWIIEIASSLLSKKLNWKQAQEKESGLILPSLSDSMIPLIQLVLDPELDMVEGCQLLIFRGSQGKGGEIMI